MISYSTWTWKPEGEKSDWLDATKCGSAGEVPLYRVREYDMRTIISLITLHRYVSFHTASPSTNKLFRLRSTSLLSFRQQFLAHTLRSKCFSEAWTTSYGFLLGSSYHRHGYEAMSTHTHNNNRRKRSMRTGKSVQPEVTPVLPLSDKLGTFLLEYSTLRGSSLLLQFYWMGKRPDLFTDQHQLSWKAIKVTLF